MFEEIQTQTSFERAHESGPFNSASVNKKKCSEKKTQKMHFIDEQYEWGERDREMRRRHQCSKWMVDISVPKCCVHRW